MVTAGSSAALKFPLFKVLSSKVGNSLEPPPESGFHAIEIT
jgi:hypothetical protein